jgi:hypothetical protein
MAQQRRWCFTNFDLDKRIEWHAIRDHAQYLVFQDEKCPETGRVHQQGYLELNRPWRLNRVKKIIHQTCHFEPARGTSEENKKYCSKSETSVEGSFAEYGQPGQQGKRNDLDAVKQDLDSGKSIQEIADKHFATFVKFHAGIEKAITLLQKKRDFRPIVTVIVGPPGSGKSKYIRDHHDQQDICTVTAMKGTPWFLGYNNHKVVVIDEFYGQWEWAFLLEVTDRHAMQVQVKGGNREFNSTHIYITSNQALDTWYGYRDYTALLRRLTHYYQVRGDQYVDTLPELLPEAPPLIPFHDAASSSSRIPSPPPLRRQNAYAVPRTPNVSPLDSPGPDGPQWSPLLQADH